MNLSEKLITPDQIELGVNASSWQSAIKAGGVILENAGIADQRYTEAMIASVEEHGPYIVIAPGFALAHARPDDSVKETGLSLIRLNQPVKFGHESNDPVSLVLSLAAKDATAHQSVLARIATILSAPAQREILDSSNDPARIASLINGELELSESSSTPANSAPAAGVTAAAGEGAGAELLSADDYDGEVVSSKGHILTVCGNGVGTSLFLKSTLEQVLGDWGWSQYVDVEATDTISAKGKAGSADLVLTSKAIADALGDLGVPVEIIADFTSKSEIDAALRRWYVY